MWFWIIGLVWAGGSLIVFNVVAGERTVFAIPLALFWPIVLPVLAAGAGIAALVVTVDLKLRKRPD